MADFNLSLFETKLLVKDDCGLDIEKLEAECRSHCESVPSVVKSNMGGHQSHDFYNENLLQLIRGNLPHDSNNPIIQYNISTWVNINGPGSSNMIHNHVPHMGTLLSGVFYVKCPPNCGPLVLLDPRSHISSAPDISYYEGGKRFHYIEPTPNTLIMFPAWLEHLVNPNESDEERISISFNIHNVVSEW